MTALTITVLAVVLISAMCSFFEAILYSVPVSHIESLAQSGRKSARLLQQLRKHVDRPIAAILSLNTIANTGGAAIAGYYAGQAMGASWLPWFSALFTLAILFFSEIIPKTAGVVYARPLALYIAHPLQFMIWVLTPIILLCRFTTRMISHHSSDSQISDDEIVSMARIGLKTGELDENEAKVIQNILSLENKMARDIMTPRTVVFALNKDSSVEDVRSNIQSFQHSRIPVFDKDIDDIIGFVHRRDVLIAFAQEKADKKFGHLMRPIHFVVDTIPLNSLLQRLLETQQHLVAVIDEFGQLVGVVTLEDVLEEILGKEIIDEFDEVADMAALTRQRRRDLLTPPGKD